MAIKKLKQCSFDDDLIVNHKALAKLDGVHSFIDWPALQSLVIFS
jgi:hypothetical protein